MNQINGKDRPENITNITIVFNCGLTPKQVDGHEHIYRTTHYDYVLRYKGYHPERDNYTLDAQKALLELLQVSREKPLLDVRITLTASKEKMIDGIRNSVNKYIDLRSDELDRIGDYLRIFDQVITARDYPYV